MALDTVSIFRWLIPVEVAAQSGEISYKNVQHNVMTNLMQRAISAVSNRLGGLSESGIRLPKSILVDWGSNNDWPKYPPQGLVTDRVKSLGLRNLGSHKESHLTTSRNGTHNFSYVTTFQNGAPFFFYHNGQLRTLESKVCRVARV
jgi:hypothetical protein